MKFKYEFYDFQKSILDKFESEIQRGDKKIHIVAPPGSGKTIVGIEMVNRIFSKLLPNDDLLIKTYNPYENKDERYVLREKDIEKFQYEGQCLILVPNITLQYQWKDKIEKLFLQEFESSDSLISLSTQEIKKINIITYQSLSQVSNEEDLFIQQILNQWYADLKKEFNNFDEFMLYVNGIKELDFEAYSKEIKKYKKRLKNDFVNDYISNKVKEYLFRLQKVKVSTIIVDEAHHLTNWWSKVLFFMRKQLNKPFVIGLTATPPFQDSDYFLLDDDYTNLLGEVDYYVPTPAIIKSGKLAPYNDLLIVVQPDDQIKNIIDNRNDQLVNFLNDNGKEISLLLEDYIGNNYDKLLKNSPTLLKSYVKFVFNYLQKDISDWIFFDDLHIDLSLEDIAKSLGKYLMLKDINQNIKIDEKKFLKQLMYNLGYIWRGTNFFKFKTPIEQMLIYSKSKLSALSLILQEEYTNQQQNLKCAVITDFLQESDDYINCIQILKYLQENFPKLNPILVSGQGIWKYSFDSNQLIELDENILTITDMLQTGKTNLLVGTRGILGEGWDCPKLNTLIDLTGISSYMSVNQVRGRAIRLDKDDEKKVANIYDIVCIGSGYGGFADFVRLEKKHENFYGVDDSGLIIKGVNHIFPNIKNHINEIDRINNNMIKRISMKDYIYSLWKIHGNYQNKEIFGLNLEIKQSLKYFPFMNFANDDHIFNFINFFGKDIHIKDLVNSNYYQQIVIDYLKIFISSFVDALISNNILPKGFKFSILKGKDGAIMVYANSTDALIDKLFIDNLKEVFRVIINQNYLIEIIFFNIENNKFVTSLLPFGMPNMFSKNIKYRKEIIANYNNNLKYLLKSKSSGYIDKKGKTVLKDHYEKIRSKYKFKVWYIKKQIEKQNGNTNFIGSLILFFKVRYNIFFKLKNNEIKEIQDLYNFFWSYEKNYDYIMKKLDNQNNKLKPIKFIYLNSKNIDKKKYIGYKPFILGNIEKLWI